MKDIFMLIGSFECNIFVWNPAFAKQLFLLPSKAFYIMETRILTLFDDEFFPPDPPKEKPKKEKAPKPATDKIAEPTETTDKEKDIIAQALNEFHEKELKENAANEPTPEHEINVDEEKTNNVSPEIVDSSEIVLEEVYNDIIVEETLMADDIDFDASQEPVFTDDVAEPIVYSDEVPEDIATEADIITSMEEENDVVDAIEENVTDELEPATNKVEVDEVTNEIAMSDVVENGITDTEAEAKNDEVIKTEVAVAENNAIVEDESADTTFKVETDNVVEDAISENNTTDDASAESVDQQASPEDKELSKQILSELIQLDYTALIQKNYAFDLNAATVINKELPKPKPQPEQVVAVQEEEEEEAEEVFEDVTPLPEWQLDKKYYTIGEVAGLFEVNTSHIRFWTNEFKLKPRTTRKGDRLYSPKDIAELRLIHHLVKVKKHTIKGAREKLKAEKTDVNNKLDLKESLVQLKDTLMKIREQL